MSHEINQSDLDEFANNNATLFVDGEPAKVGDILSGSPPGTPLKAVANSGYEFTSQTFPISRSSVAFYNGGSNRINFSVQSPPSTATLTVPADSGSYFEVVTDSFADYIVHVDDMQYLANHNTTMFSEGVEFSEGLAIFEGDEIKAVADDGFQFIKVEFLGSGGYPSEYTLSEPPTEATTFYYNDVEKLVYNIVTEQTGSDVTGNNNIYLVDAEIMKLVNYERFTETIIDGDIKDYGTFILGLIKLPFAVPDEYKLENQFINLGDRQLTTKAVELNSDVFIIEMGTVNVPEKFGDFRDYQQTICKLHLPHSTTINVEPEYVIGCDLSVEYRVSLYDGSVTINLYSSAIGDECFFTQNSTLGISVPYSADSGDSLYLNNPNLKVGGNNDLVKCYVEVLRNESPLSNKFFTIPVDDELPLSECSGYVEVENIKANFPTLADEYDEIVSTLANGVILND